MRCQEWIQGDPWTYPDGDGILNHYYDVEACDTAGALELAFARGQIAAEDIAAGQISRFPRFDEPGGKLLQPGQDDEPGEPMVRMLQVKETVSRPRRIPCLQRRGICESANVPRCVRRSNWHAA